MSYEDTLQRLGSTTAKIMRGIVANLEAGLIDVETAKDLAAIVLETAGAQGEALGALSFEAHARVSTGSVYAGTPPSAVATVPADAHRVNKALVTILAGDPEQITMRLERLGFADPVNMAQQAFSNGMRSDPRIDGWVRGLERDACQLCRWWWREGRMWDADHVMPTHTGCTCVQVPKFKTKQKDGTWGNVKSEPEPRAGSGRLRGGGLKPKRK